VSGDVVARAYARASSLKERLPEGRVISGRYFEEYHDALKPLQALGLDVSEFLVPHTNVRPIVSSGNYLTGEVRYSKEPYVDRALLLAKLSAILMYFSMGERNGTASGLTRTDRSTPWL
jgi:hypothetical protein